MSVSGTRISSTEPELKSGQMVQSMKVNIKMVKSMEMAVLLLLMVVHTQDSLDIMRYLDLASTSGLMARCMKESGKTIKCTDEVLWYGETVNVMKVNLYSIKERDMVLLNGKMVEYMKGNGKMGNNMVSEYSLQKIIKLRKVNG